ncbi:MAG: 5-methylcytosine-specific restriction endonuclease McrA, partial [Hyphomicrobiaceae bacterium]
MEVKREAPDSPNLSFPAANTRATAARGRITPLAPRRYKVEITVDQQTHDKLRALEDLLSHQVAGDPAAIISRAIELLLAETLKKKAALTDRPQKPRSSSAKEHRTRAIPAALRRAVWLRDVGRCRFEDDKGHRCRTTRNLQFHHKMPYGRGGQHELENIELRCHGHNQYQADQDFGLSFMRAKRGGSYEQSARTVGERRAFGS